MGSIVVGYIDTPEGEAALEKAVEEAQLRDARIVVMHSMVGGTHEKEEEYLASAEALEAVTDRLTDAGIDFCTHEYVRGNRPVDDIMAAVEDHRAMMIVIGIRRRTTTGKVLLGSNALDILHDTKVPVLCVKAKES